MAATRTTQLPRTLDALLARLAELDDAERESVAAMLVSSETTAVLGLVRAQAIHALTKRPGATYETVAADLGISTVAVNKAVTRARKAAAQTMPAE